MQFKTYKGYLLQVFDPSHGNYIIQFIGVSIAAVASFVMPIKGFLFMIGALVLADLFTGWRKSVRLAKEAAESEGDPIALEQIKARARLNSKGVGKTIEKTALYLVVMLVSRGVDMLYALDGTFTLSWFVGGLVVGRELLSVFENTDAVLGTDFAPRIRDVWERLTSKHKPAE